MPLDIPITAEKKQAWNPGKRTGPGFTSGWHLLKSKKETEEYLKRFKRKEDIVVCQILAKGLWQKPRSKVTLAETILIPEQSWLHAIKSHPYFDTDLVELLGHAAV